MYTAQKLFSLLAFFFVFLFLVFIQTTIASDESDVGFDYVIEEGELFVDIVDELSGVSIDNPIVDFGEGQFSNDPISAFGVLGTSSESVRLFNYTSHPSWTLNLAGENPANEWSSDFDNYPFNSPDDASLGRLSVNPESALISSDVDCSIDGISTGSLATYQSGLVDSIDLMFASSSASPFCRFDLQEVDLEQIVPGSQPVGTYTLGMVLTASYSPGDDPESSGPLGLDTEVTDDGILLGWSAPDEEDDYLYKVERSSSPWRTLVERTSDTSYLDDDIEEGVSYSYRITSYNSSGVAGVSDASIPMVTWRVSYVSSSGGSVTPVMRLVENGGFVSGVQTFPDEGFHLVNFEVIQGEGNGFLHEPTGAVVNVTGGMRVRANFAINEYDLTYLAGDNGSVTVESSSQSVSYGSDGAPVEAIPDEGYYFIQWSDGSTDNPRIDTNVTSNIEVTAIFGLNVYTVDIAPEPVGGGTFTGDGNYDHGDSVTIEAFPSAGYQFTSWLEDGNIVSVNLAHTFTIVESRDFIANFTLNEYTISYTSTEGGSVSPEFQSISHGAASQAPTVVTDTGYTFVDFEVVSGSGNGNLETNGSVTNVVGDMTVRANFVINEYEISVVANPVEGGGVTGGGVYTYNSDITLVATPDTSNGYHFVDWREDTNFVSDNTNYSFLVTENRILVANFALNTYTVEYISSVGGSIDPASRSVVHGGTSAAPTVVADTGYTFVDFEVVSGVVNGNLETNGSVTNVTGDMTIRANFLINEYTLVYTAGANGAITGDTEQNVNHGDDGTQVTAIPDTGYHFVQWSDGVQAESRTDTNVTENISVTAIFAINEYIVTLSSNPVEGGSTTGEGTYEHGDSVSVTAFPGEDYDFLNWSEGGSVITASEVYTFVITDNRDLVANFELNPEYEVSYASSPGGSLSPPASSTELYDRGSTLGGEFWDGGEYYNVDFTITVPHGGDTPNPDPQPTSGYYIVNYTMVGGAGNGNLNTSTGEVTHVTGEIEVRADFSRYEYTVSYTSNSGGSVSPSSRTVLHGENSDAPTVTTDSGHDFVNFVVESGSGNGTLNSSTGAVTNVTGDMVVRANFESQAPTFECSGNITDADGNSYPTVEAGSQCWMGANLRTTKYNNGNTISHLSSDAQWSSTNSGAWSYQGNDSSNNIPYGKLYNYYAVADSRGICPEGWRVPDRSDFNALESFVGSNPGGKLKETGTTHWLSPNSGATNSIGFSAVGGGARQDTGNFVVYKMASYWWVNELSSSSRAYIRLVRYDATDMPLTSGTFRSGMAVRCLMDQHTVSYISTSGGSVSPSSMEVNHGMATTTPTVTPDLGYEFTNFSVSSGIGNGTLNTSTGVVTNVIGNITIRANFQPIDVDCPSTVTDAAGNTYSTVAIGQQCWMSENLKTTKYASGATIPNVTSSSEWGSVNYGAWTYYDNNSTYNSSYGKLYNYYAVQDSRGLCPTGWKLPSRGDFNSLTAYIGSSPGGKLKETGTTHWRTPNIGATNSTGFTGRPGGGRQEAGSYVVIHDAGYWWTTTTFGSNRAYIRLVRYDAADMPEITGHFNSGISVRCLKN